MKGTTLRRRLQSLLVQWFVVFLAVAGVVSAFAFARFRRDAAEERLLLARAVAQYLDSSIGNAFHGLAALADGLPALDESAVPRLRSFRFQSLFRDEIYVLDTAGRPLVADPAFATPLPRRWLEGREEVTPLLTPDGATPSVAIVQPFRRHGRSGYLVAEMNPLGSGVSAFLQSLTGGHPFEVVVVDGSGRVIAAPDQKQLFRRAPRAAEVTAAVAARRSWVGETGTCTICPETGGGGRFVAAVEPLELAPWGVLVVEEARHAYAAVYALQWGFGLAALLLGLMGVVLFRGVSRSVVQPIQELSRQADELRRGNLSTPIHTRGDREVAVLGATLEGARRQLASTLAELRSLNEDLEGQVAGRTRALQEQYEDLKLLHDLAEVTAREREPERFVPRVLRLLADHYGLAAAAMVTTPRMEPAQTYVHPPDRELPWLEPGAEAPAGWQRHDLVYQGRSKALLFVAAGTGGETWFPEALENQLALSLHGAYLLIRTAAQDAQRKALVRRLLAAGEEERRRIARELHDEISQLLTVIQLSLDDVGGDAAALAKAKDLLTRTQQEVHRVIFDLRPSLLDDLGLAAAVKWYGNNYLEKQGLEVRLEVEEELPLPADVEISVFRIYQEIVTNILRHAGAETVSVELYRTAGELVLAVEDDGRGFDPAAKSEGVGLVGMRERAELVGGSIRFDSEPGMGTHVQLRIPLSG